MKYINRLDKYLARASATVLWFGCSNFVAEQFSGQNQKCNCWVGSASAKPES